MAVGLVQIGDGSPRKKEGSVGLWRKRRDGKAMRRETRRKENESKKE